MSLEVTPTDFSKNSQVSNSIKIRPVRADLFHASGLTDRHNEVVRNFANGDFLNAPGFFFEFESAMRQRWRKKTGGR